MRNQLVIELSIVSILWAVNCIVIVVSYKKGSDAWRDKFSFTRTQTDGSRIQVSGVYGELFVNLFWFLGYIVVSLSSAKLSVFDMNTAQTLFLLLLTLGVITWAVRYPETVVRKEKNRSEHYLQNLRAGYTYYPLFAVIFYLGAFVVAAKIIYQYMMEVEAFFEIADQFLSDHANIIRQAANGLDLYKASELERAFNRFNTINRGVIQQLEPIVIFVTYVMIVVMLVAQTPMRSSFHKDARKIGFYVSFAAIGVIFLTALMSYYFQYSDFSATYQRQLQDALYFTAADFSYLTRVSQMLDQVMKFSGFSGFLRIFTEEGGIYVIAIGLIQVIAGVVSKKMEESQPL